MDSLAHRFGPAPIGELPNGVVVLMCQWILSAVILMAVSPPFVTEVGGACNAWYVLAWASIGTASTVCMYWGQVDPTDTFMTGGKLLYRLCQ